MRQLTALALAFAVMASIGCYAERLAPPAFRFSCDRDADCREPEACIQGLCQIPCTQATFREDCPSVGSYALCFNGVCSNVCTVGAGHCPEPQECTTFPFDPPSGNGGPGGAAPPPEDPIGICGVACSPGDGTCPEGEQCLQGFCVQTCEFDIECQDGFACIAGLCLPEEIEIPGATGTTGDVENETDTDTDTDTDDLATDDGDETATGGSR
jgi:hypothetical protein